jgi:hypothetical protein
VEQRFRGAFGAPKLIALEGDLDNHKGGLFWLLLCCLPIYLLSGCGKQNRVDSPVSIASPCVLVAEPSEHSDQRIKVTAYITSTKEGAFIWGDDCKNSVIALHFGEALARDPKLQGALLNYGMSPAPIRATLVGRFRYKRFTGLRALIFGEKAFDAEQVLDLQINPRTGVRSSPELSPRSEAEPR